MQARPRSMVTKDILRQSVNGNAKDWRPVGSGPGLLKARKHVLRELRKRIVPGAHDHDAIAAAGQLHQLFAAGVAIRKREGSYGRGARSL